MTDSKLFWLLAGAVVARCVEGRAAKACLGDQWFRQVFAPRNVGRPVVDLSGASCEAPVCPPANCPPPRPCPAPAPCECPPGSMVAP